MPPPPPPKKVPPPKPSSAATPSPSPAPNNQNDIYGAPPQQQQQQPNNQAPQSGNYAPPPQQQQSNNNFASQPSNNNFASQPSNSNFGAQASSSGYTPPPPQREPSRSSLKPPSTPSHRASTPTENAAPAGSNTTPPARPPQQAPQQQQAATTNASQPATPHSAQQARPTPASPPASPRKGPVSAPPPKAAAPSSGPRFVEQDDGSLKRDHKVGVPSVADALEAAGYVVDEQRQKAVAQDTVVLSPTRHSFPVIKYDRAHLYEPLECTRLFPYEAPPVNKPSSTRRRTEDFLQQRRQVAPAPMFDPTVEEGSSRMRPDSFMMREEGGGTRDAKKGKEPYSGYNELVREVNEFDMRHALADEPGFNMSNATNNESYSGWGAERSGSRRPNQSAQQQSYQQQPRTTMPADSFSLYSRPNDGSPGNVPTIQHYRTKWETSPTSAQRRGGSQAERYGRHYNEASSRGGSQSTY